MTLKNFCYTTSLSVFALCMASPVWGTERKADENLTSPATSSASVTQENNVLSSQESDKLYKELKARNTLLFETFIQISDKAYDQTMWTADRTLGKAAWEKPKKNPYLNAFGTFLKMDAKELRFTLMNPYPPYLLASFNAFFGQKQCDRLGAPNIQPNQLINNIFLRQGAKVGDILKLLPLGICAELVREHAPFAVALSTADKEIDLLRKSMCSDMNSEILRWWIRWPLTPQDIQNMNLQQAEGRLSTEDREKCPIASFCLQKPIYESSVHDDDPLVQLEKQKTFQWSWGVYLGLLECSLIWLEDRYNILNTKLTGLFILDSLKTINLEELVSAHVTESAQLEHSPFSWKPAAIDQQLDSLAPLHTSQPEAWTYLSQVMLQYKVLSSLSTIIDNFWQIWHLWGATLEQNKLSVTTMFSKTFMSKITYYHTHHEKIKKKMYLDSAQGSSAKHLKKMLLKSYKNSKPKTAPLAPSTNKKTSKPVLLTATPLQTPNVVFQTPKNRIDPNNNNNNLNTTLNTSSLVTSSVPSINLLEQAPKLNLGPVPGKKSTLIINDKAIPKFDVADPREENEKKNYSSALETKKTRKSHNTEETTQLLSELPNLPTLENTEPTSDNNNNRKENEERVAKRTIKLGSTYQKIFYKIHGKSKQTAYKGRILPVARLIEKLGGVAFSHEDVGMPAHEQGKWIFSFNPDVIKDIQAQRIKKKMTKEEMLSEKPFNISIRADDTWTIGTHTSHGGDKKIDPNFVTNVAALLTKAGYPAVFEFSGVNDSDSEYSLTDLDLSDMEGK